MCTVLLYWGLYLFNVISCSVYPCFSTLLYWPWSRAGEVTLKDMDMFRIKTHISPCRYFPAFYDVRLVGFTLDGSPLRKRMPSILTLSRHHFYTAVKYALFPLQYLVMRIAASHETPSQFLRRPHPWTPGRCRHSCVELVRRLFGRMLPLFPAGVYRSPNTDSWWGSAMVRINIMKAEWPKRKYILS